MLEFLIDNIFVMFGGTVFQQTDGIPMGTNCAPLLTDLFFYSYKENFTQKNEKKLVDPLISSYSYMVDVLSLNNSKFCYFVDGIYPIELEIKDTTDTVRCVSHLDLHIEIDSGD